MEELSNERFNTLVAKHGGVGSAAVSYKYIYLFAIVLILIFIGAIERPEHVDENETIDPSSRISSGELSGTIAQCK